MGLLGHSVIDIAVANSAVLMATFTDVVALVLLYASFAKLSDPIGFRVVLLGYGAMPSGLAASLAIATPLAEIAIGVSLLVPPLRPIAAAGAAGFFGIAAVMIGVSLTVGRVPAVCGCLSTKTGNPPNLWTVARLLTLASGLVVVAASPEGRADMGSGMTVPLILSIETIVAWSIASQLIRIYAKSNRMAHILELRSSQRPALAVNGTPSHEQAIERPHSTNEAGG